MSSSCKRPKLNEIIKWKAILSDEYLITNFTLKKYVIGDVKECKKMSQLISSLQQSYPLNNQNKFKRVKKVDQNQTNNKSIFQVLICDKDKFNGLSDELCENLQNIKEIDLPVDKILTRIQYDIVTKNYWPIHFHLDKYIESLLDKSFMIKNEDLMLKNNFYSRIGIELACFFNSSSAVIIVDPRSDTVVASGIDIRDKHPLNHSVMNAIYNVSKRQLKEFKNLENKLDDCLDLFLESKSNKNETLIDSKYEILEKNYRKDLDKNDYLCTNYHVYMTHEPCSMCAMALVHSRVSKVYYLFNTKYGYLNTKFKLHCHSELNHNFEAYEAIDFHLDSDCTSYFTDLTTKHVNYIKKE